MRNDSQLETIAIRYRNGTLLSIKLNVIEELKTNVQLVLEERNTRNKTIKQISDGAGWGIAKESTWPQLLSELICEFERLAENHATWRPILKDYIELITQDKPSYELWDNAKLFLHNHVDILSGWSWSVKKMMSTHLNIYRKGDKYFSKERGEEIECLGGRTIVEERVDYIADSITHKYQLLHSMLKVFSLTCVERLLNNGGEFSSSARIELGEGDNATWFLHWRWVTKWPYLMRPVAWRPNDNLCDPDWLANDLIVFISEAEKLEAGPDYFPRSPDLAGKWNEKFGQTTKQTSFALTSNLRIGSGNEEWIEFRGHTYRWINHTQSSYPTIVATHLDDESDRDVSLRTFKFLSHVAFIHDYKVEIGFWGGLRSGLNPGVSNPRRGSTTQYPTGYNYETTGPDQDTLDFALSLYREGVSSDSVFYGFLNFYKIIQIPFGERGKDIAKWLEENAPKMPSYDNPQFQADLKLSGQNVSDYLWDSNRCAISHVTLDSGKQVINPDDIDHQRRVSNSIYVIKELAKFAIKNGITPPAKQFKGEILKTKRLRLRWMEPTDLKSLHALLSDAVVMKYYPKPLNEEESRGWLERVLAGYEKYGYGFYVVEDLKTGEFIGQIGLLPQILEGNVQPELGYLLRSQYFGKGFATEAGKACLSYGFNSFRFPKIVSFIRPENMPSRKVATRLGLKEEREIDWKGYQHLLHVITKEEFVDRYQNSTT